MVDDNSESRKFSAEELRHLFRPNFDTLSATHDNLGCTCYLNSMLQQLYMVRRAAALPGNLFCSSLLSGDLFCSNIF